MPDVGAAPATGRSYGCAKFVNFIGVGTNRAGGAIAPPPFYRKKEMHLLALQTAKQTGLNVTGL